MQRELSIILENKPGALVRVVGLFHQRGYNIESLHVDPVTDLTKFSYVEERLDIKLEENESEDDTVFKKNGAKVIIDSVSLEFLAGAIIDYSEEIIGAKFTIQNPNATSSCGCGTSFSV